MQWYDIKPVEEKELHNFEDAFCFRISEPMRGYLLRHNGGRPVSGTFPTTERARKLEQFLNFSKEGDPRFDAWAVNKRLRSELGGTRIAIGIDTLGNFVCIERHYRHQKVVVWNHLTGKFEPSLLDIPVLLRALGN